MSEFITAGKKEDFEEGKGKLIESNGKKIALYLKDGNFHAFDNECKHMGGPLCDGSLEEENIVCPWHGWKYNIKTGVSPVNADAKVNTYNVKIEDNEVKIEI
ncbi:non-heme iron oxygenase ferredoxin subunit [archaeon]|nr:non-heme iron oxygenase ferredoxin subunit [archaeon]